MLFRFTTCFFPTQRVGVFLNILHYSKAHHCNLSEGIFNSNLLRRPLLSTLYRNYSYFYENMSTESKKLKTTLKIGTHDGRFHCDEVLACFMLKQLKEYENAEIIRSRDESILKGCDIIVDVGQIFNKEEKKFDHHQRSFNETLSSVRSDLGEQYNTRLSSAGLIYAFYGEEIIAKVLKKQKNIILSSDQLLLLYKILYRNFIEEIDAIDNGVQICDGEPCYVITTHLSARVENFNPQWNSDNKVDADTQFHKAMKYAGNEFTDILLNYATIWLPCRDIVTQAIKNAESVHESGEIIELSRTCPWKSHLYDLEKQYNIVGKIKYVLFKDITNGWRVTCVPRKPNSFICRKFLHPNWRGMRNNDLVKLTGIEGVSFCHHNGFIGGANSREGVLQMAIQSLLDDYTD